MALKSSKRFLVTDAKVFVVGVQKVNKSGLKQFLKSEGHEKWTTVADEPSEILPELAGRLCYMSFEGGRGHDEYVENLKRDRHGSVLEHAMVSFILTGVSRSFTHELVRHRAGWAYSQLSQRYVDEMHAQFVVPWAIERKPGLRALFDRAMSDAHESYRTFQIALAKEYAGVDQVGKPNKLSTRLTKIVRGAARAILPNATETKIFCTVNARALRHFLEMRASEAADHEIRGVAMEIYRAVLPFMPTILSDYVVHTDVDGIEYLSTQHVKV